MRIGHNTPGSTTIILCSTRFYGTLLDCVVVHVENYSRFIAKLSLLRINFHDVELSNFTKSTRPLGNNSSDMCSIYLWNLKDITQSRYHLCWIRTDNFFFKSISSKLCECVAKLVKQICILQDLFEKMSTWGADERGEGSILRLTWMKK